MELELHWSGDWPEYVEPLLAALESLPETEDAAEGSVAFCPDAVQFAPPVSDRALVAMIPQVDLLLDPAQRVAVADGLAQWARRGALFTVPTPAAAATLRALLNLEPSRVRVLPLPLPPGRIPPHTTSSGHDILALGGVDVEVILSATRLLRLAGLDPRLLLAAPNGPAIAQPGGGSAAAHGLMPGHEVVAVADWREAVAQAGVLVLGTADLGTGWVLREALACGRPVVVPSTPWTRDHLAAVGADAYLYSTLPNLVSAVAAALRRQRGQALEAAAYEAVRAESWENAARTLYRVLSDAVAPEPAPVRTAPIRTSTAAVVREPLRVCVVNPNANGGGGETFMHQLSVAMASHASTPEITLVCQVRPGALFDHRTSTLTEAGVRTSVVHGEDLTTALSEAANANVVYYAWPHASDPPAISAPLVCTIHDVNWKHFDIYSPQERAMIERQVPAWLGRASAVTHSSEFIRSEVERYYGASPSLQHVIPTAAQPPGTPTSPEQRNRVCHRFGLPRRFLLSPNGAHRNKNYPVLESALRVLRKDGRPVPVIASGMGTEFFHGPDLIGLGYIRASEVRALYELCDGIVQPTLYEAGSFPLFEAMAMHKPVAISKIPPIVEQVERAGATAELFDPLDPVDVAAAIWRLWDGSPVTVPAVLAANANAVAARTWDDVAGDYLKLFSEVSR
jgi:glycosyltransferase involved in cell wall biosynthesis